MKKLLLVIAIAVFALSGCGDGDQAAESAAEAALDAAATAAQAVSGVPDPCALITSDEAASLGGSVEAGVEQESAWPNIRRCTWDGSGDGFYGVGVIVDSKGIESAREMLLGEAAPIEDLGTPGFFEMIEGGVAGIGVEQGGVSVYVQPVWTSRPAADSERAETLKRVALAAAGRL